MEIVTGIAGDTVESISEDLSFSATFTKSHLPNVLEDQQASELIIKHDTPTASNTRKFTEGRGNIPVTVFTVNYQGFNKPSVTFIAPTITTNSLPTGLSNATFPYTVPSFNISHDTPTLSHTFSNSTYVSVYSDVDSTSTKPSLTSLSKTKKSSTLSSSTISSSSELFTSVGTVTITEYLEEVTYTQAYVITDSRTTFSTAFLATTSFYINSLTSTYSISPAAITTDVNGLKSRFDFEELFKKHGLSKGAIAGISVGGILAFFCLVGFLTYVLLRKRKAGRFNSATDDYDIERDYSGDFSNNVNEDVLQDNVNSFKPAPPIPNRDTKPHLDDIATLEEDDLGLFDMKSTLNSIANHNIKPPPIPLPKVRKNRGLNAINKLNYTISDAPTTPVSQIPCDRTMGVLYESPNEHPIWDEYDTNKTPEFITKDVMVSPIRRFPHKDSNSAINTDSDNEDFDFFKNSLHVPRVRSSSGATRYEYLSNNVESFKQELRLSSPLKTSFDIVDTDFNIKKQPPPVPEPRKSAK